MSHPLVLSRSLQKGKLRQAEHKNPKVKYEAAELNQKQRSLDALATAQDMEGWASFVLE